MATKSLTRLMSALKAGTAGIAMLTASSAAQSPASAMTFGSVDVGNNTLFVTMEGPIENGDEGRFRQFLQTIAATHIKGWAMHSQGGVIREAVEMAEDIAKIWGDDLLAG